MARKKTEEQLVLIDVGPENAKAIAKEARKYKSAQSTRIEALEQEMAAKIKLLALIKTSGIKPMEDGKIRCHCDGFTITVTPRDELVKVKEDAEEKEDA